MLHIRRSTTDILLWASILVTIIACYIWAIGAQPYPDPMFATINGMVCLVSFVGLAMSRRTGIASAVNAFCIVFLCIIPLFGRINEIVYWGASSTQVFAAYPFAAAILLVCMIVFNFLYHIRIKIPTPQTRQIHQFGVRVLPLILLSWLALLVIAYINNFSLISMMIRGGDLQNRVDLGSSSVDLIYRTFIYPIPAICFCLYATTGRRQIPILLLLAIPLLIGNSPTGTARFTAATIYIAVLISLFPILHRSNIRIPALLIIGILVAFPTLNQFRHYEGGIPAIKIIDMETLYEGHFDTFQSITSAMDYPPSLGYQLLGPLLFWVPRSAWPSKPIGSGAEVSEYANLTFDNISMNFFGEGIMNFGLPGALIFAFAGALIARRIDGSFDSIDEKSPRAVLISIFMIGMSVFVMRGDLMSSFAFSVSIISSIWIVCLIATRRIPSITRSETPRSG